MKLLLGLALLRTVLAADSPVPEWNMAFEPSGAVQVGDRVKFTLPEAPPAFELRNPEPKGSLLDLGWAFDRASDGTTFLIPVKGGGVVPPLEVWDVTIPPGKLVARTRAAQIAVQGLPEPAKEPVPALPPAHLPLPWTLVVLLGMLALAAAVGLGILVHWAWRKWRASRAKRNQGPPLSEDEQALLELDRLLKEGLIQKARYKPYYYRASDILKKYLGERYDFDAVESTSHEIVTRMEDQRLAEDRVVDRIEKLFEKLDLVKFTDAIPSLEDSQQAVEEISSLVKSTRKIRVVTPAGGPGARR